MISTQDKFQNQFNPKHRLLLKVAEAIQYKYKYNIIQCKQSSTIQLQRWIAEAMLRQTLDAETDTRCRNRSYAETDGLLKEKTET